METCFCCQKYPTSTTMQEFKSQYSHTQKLKKKLGVNRTLSMDWTGKDMNIVIMKLASY